MNLLWDTACIMSWLFGLNKGQDASQIPDIQLPVPPSGGGGGGGSDDKGDGNQGQPANSKMEAYRFDSAALERAARAAKDLEKSSK